MVIGEGNCNDHSLLCGKMRLEGRRRETVHSICSLQPSNEKSSNTGAHFYNVARDYLVFIDSHIITY